MEGSQLFVTEFPECLYTIWDTWSANGTYAKKEAANPFKHTPHQVLENGDVFVNGRRYEKTSFGYQLRGQMHLYLVTCPEHLGWDSYECFVVAAETAQAARMWHPDGGPFHESKSWTKRPEDLHVACIGVSNLPLGQPTVICASFHAG